MPRFRIVMVYLRRVRDWFAAALRDLGDMARTDPLAFLVFATVLVMAFTALMLLTGSGR